MKVSLIIPTWNATLYLHAALTTLRQQTYPIHQIVVVDDKSDSPYAEEQCELCEEFGATYLYYSAEKKMKRRGGSNQFGLRYLEGGVPFQSLGDSVVGFCCVDHVYYPDYLEKIVSVLEQYENAVVFSNTRGLPYYKLGTKTPLVRCVLELLESGEIESQVRSDNESQWYSYTESWWSTLDDIHPTNYGCGCDGNAFLRTKYARLYDLWDVNMMGHGSHCTDFAYNCIVHGLSCVVLKDATALNVDHDKPPLILQGSAEATKLFQKKWVGVVFPRQTPLIPVWKQEAEE